MEATKSLSGTEWHWHCIVPVGCEATYSCLSVLSSRRLSEQELSAEQKPGNELSQTFDPLWTEFDIVHMISQYHTELEVCEHFHTRKQIHERMQAHDVNVHANLQSTAVLDEL